jgi:hypothetical protein
MSPGSEIGGAVIVQKRCKATKQDGSPCNGMPYKGGPFCWFHDPAQSDRRAEGRRLGGAARSNLRRARKQLPGTVLTMPEIQGFLGKALQDVLEGKLEPGVGTAAASIARTLHQIAVAVDLEARVAELEQTLGVKEKAG